MSYALPSNTSWITASWQDHKDRNPPSSEPGTDYGSAWGAPLYAVADGQITYVKESTSNATGRVIEYRLDDGRTTRSLHLSEVWVGVGQRVSRGQQIGRTGASGFGNEWGYGAHVHQTLWPGNAWADPPIDFARYVGDTAPDPTPEPEPEPTELELLMTHAVIYTNDTPDETRRGAIIDLETGYVSRFAWFDANYAHDIARGFGHSMAGPLSSGQFDTVIADLGRIHPAPIPDTASDVDTRANPLVTPAWVGGVLLGLIGLVEVVRLFVDLVRP